MDQPQITRQQALEYIASYAELEKVNLSECIKINTEEKIRGIIGAAEFEYQDRNSLLIIRGLVNKDIDFAPEKFKILFMDKLYQFNTNPLFDMAGGKFEFDSTAFELQQKYPERINLRLDFNTPIQKKFFVKKVDALMDATYSFKVNEYQPIFDEVVEIVHPSK